MARAEQVLFSQRSSFSGFDYASVVRQDGSAHHPATTDAGTSDRIYKHQTAVMRQDLWQALTPSYGNRSILFLDTARAICNLDVKLVRLEKECTMYLQLT